MTSVNEYYTKLVNKDLNNIGQKNFIVSLQVENILKCLTICKPLPSCVMARFKSENCMLYGSVQISSLINSGDSFLYFKRSLNG